MYKYTIIGLIILNVVICLVLKKYFKKKSGIKINDNKDLSNRMNSTGKSEMTTIVFEELTDIDKYEMKKTEITDSKILLQLTDIIPDAANKLMNQRLSDQKLYKVKIPKNKELIESKSGKGFRAMYKDSNGRFSGNAELIPVVGRVSEVMNVASMIVGQYYIVEIDKKLSQISRSLDKVSEFQDKEFKSRILSLVSLVENLSNFSSEILTNDEFRKIKLNSLSELERECVQLLGKVNLDINTIVTEVSSVNYQMYENDVNQLDVLMKYQTILLNLLHEISQLNYLFGKGEIPIEMTTAALHKYVKISMDSKNEIEGWHEKRISELQINLLEKRRKKMGTTALVSKIPGMFSEQWQYNKINTEVISKIKSQSKPVTLVGFNESSDFYNDDIEIVVDGEKYYYINK